MRAFISILTVGALVAACGDDTASSGAGGSGGAGTGGGGATTTATSATTATTTAETTAVGTGGEGPGSGGGTGSGGDTGTGGAGTGGASNATPVCEDLLLPPDNSRQGACVDLVDHECNPVTNEGCDEGFQCDIAFSDTGTSFTCFEPEFAGTEGLCDFCNENDTFCAVGMSCTFYYWFDSPNIDQACAKYCCEDSDCGTGRCEPFQESYALPGGLCIEGAEIIIPE